MHFVYKYIQCLENKLVKHQGSFSFISFRTIWYTNMYDSGVANGGTLSWLKPVFSFKYVGYCNWSSASSLTFTCWQDNLRCFSFILLKFVYVFNTSSQTSSTMATGYCQVCSCFQQLPAFHRNKIPLFSPDFFLMNFRNSMIQWTLTTLPFDSLV